MILAAPQTEAKMKLWQKIETLPDDRVQEVLDFVELLLFSEPPETAKLSPQEAVRRLTARRERIYQRCGVYQGDWVAEARAERGHHLDVMLGLETSDESGH
jgi:hypothetical protein